MAKKIDPTLAEILRKYGANPETDIWDCHGTWVAYHRTLEKIASAAGVRFDPPTIIESDSQSGVVAICVVGHIGDRSEWSIGEAAPKNNKNAYPYAMAEKRAKDRVIIKLVGLHGVYSEDEADEFKDNRPPTETGELISPEQIEALQTAIVEVNADLPKFLQYLKVKSLSDIPTSDYKRALAALNAKRQRAKEAA